MNERVAKVCTALVGLWLTGCVICNRAKQLDANCNVTYTRNDLIIDYTTNQSVNCINNIKAPDGHRISITILELNIREQSDGHSSCKNYLSFSPVAPDNTRVLKLCGQTENGSVLESRKQIISFNSSLTFQFHIDRQLRLVLKSSLLFYYIVYIYL